MSEGERVDIRHCPARADVGPVVALGRRQDHAVAQPARAASPGSHLSISVTTRPKRAGRARRPRTIISSTSSNFDGDEAQGRIAGMGRRVRKLLRHAAQAGGKALAQGRDVLFDIDWQGTQQLRDKMRADDLVSVFILPPSVGELERRLQRARPGQERRDPRSDARKRGRRDEPLGGIRLRASSTSDLNEQFHESARESSSPSASSASDSPASRVFVAQLQAQLRRR